MKLSAMTELTNLLREIELPGEIRWVDDEAPRCILAYGEGMGTGGHRMLFVSWLVVFRPSEFGGDPKMYVWRIEFKFGSFARGEAFDKDDVRRRVLKNAEAFQEALRLGTIEPIEDGGILP